MALQRLSLSDIETAILELMHYTASTLAPWGTSAKLYTRINDYIQRLPVIVAGLMNATRIQAKLPPLDKVPRFSMWRTQTRMTTTAGESNVYFPEDYDDYISFYDETNKCEINVVTNVNQYHKRLKLKPDGPPEAIELFGGLPAQSAATYLKYGILYPRPVSGVKPDITLEYWRVPRKMPGTSASTEYPDIEPKFQQLAVYGPASDLARAYGKDYQRYEEQANQMLLQLAQVAILA